MFFFTRMISFFFFFVYFILISNCNASGLSKENQKKIDDAFDHFFWGWPVSNLFRYNSHLQQGIVEKAVKKLSLSDYHEFRDSDMEYGLIRMIEKDNENCVEAYKFRIVSDYITKNIFFGTNELYDGTYLMIDRTQITPLMYAVILNRYGIVKKMVEASFDMRLQLDTPHKTKALVNARSIARKICDKTSREKMLEILKIDPSKHKKDINDRILKKEDITVKQAVLANNQELVEAALFKGNFGNKEDENIIRWAMINENIGILEMLVLEGYKIPGEKNRPSYSIMNKAKVNFLLNEKKPLPRDDDSI